MSWDEDRVKELHRLFNDGLSRAEIAASLNLPYQAIVNKLRRERLFRARPTATVETREIKRRKVTTQGMDWEQKVVLPYAQWKIWNRQRRAENGKEA